MSRSVKLLKEKQLLETKISTVDKREQMLQLTPEGLVLSQNIARENRVFYQQAFKGFSDDEKRVLQALLMKMLANLQINGLDAIG